MYGLISCPKCKHPARHQDQNKIVCVYCGTIDILCPKCGKTFENFGILAEKKEDAEILMITHGNRRCFLNFDEANKVVALDVCDCGIVSIHKRWRCKCHMTEAEKKAEDEYWEKEMKDSYSEYLKNDEYRDVYDEPRDNDNDFDYDDNDFDYDFDDFAEDYY